MDTTTKALAIVAAVISVSAAIMFLVSDVFVASLVALAGLVLSGFVVQRQYFRSVVL
jgi:hypothetical protein